MTTLELLALLHLMVLSVASVVILRGLFRMRRGVESLEHEVRELRLTSRARISTASMQSGAPSEVQTLRRLGRASAAHRVVVGGDDDSLQKQRLQRQTLEKEDVDG